MARVAEALAGLPCAPDEVLMIGDSVARDLVAGRRAGLATARISPPTFVPPEHASLVDFHVPTLLALARFG